MKNFPKMHRFNEKDTKGVHRQDPKTGTRRDIVQRIPRGPKVENFEFGQEDFRVAKLRFTGFGQKGTEPIAEIAWAERRLSEVHPQCGHLDP